MRRVLPIATALLLIASALGDHYFRDEFYYLACSRHLDWGYVDHPPLSIALLWAVRQLFGESLLTLRVVAACMAGASVWMTGSIARRLGAGAFGETLAMLAFALAPQILAIGSFYSMNVADLLIWTIAIRLALDLLESPSLARWLLLGVVLGLGLENKISVLWLGAGLTAGIALTNVRLFLTPGPWAAALTAGVLFAPHVVWQLTHGWPTLEFIRNAAAVKMQTNTPVGFLRDQVINMNPFLFPVWLGGLLFLLVSRARPHRAIGIIFLTVTVILILNRTSRSVYLAAAYPPLFAAGGVVAEHLVVRSIRRAAVLGVVLIAGLASAPLALPLLPTDLYVRYSSALGLAPATEERSAVGRLPQFFADRQGWDQFVTQVADAWDTLTPAERSSAAVFASNYGEAGAIDLLGRSRGLVSLSDHNNYWIWGPRGYTGSVLIVIRGSRGRLDEQFASVVDVAPIRCGDCMPYENRQRIYIARGLKTPLQALWPELKHFE